MLNVADALSHRSGLTSQNALWSQGGNGVYLRKADIMLSFAYMQRIKDFRTSFQYCNFAFWLADEIVTTKLTQTFGTFVANRIFAPLKMTRSFIKATRPLPPNSETPYTALKADEFVQIQLPVSEDGSATTAAGGVISSLKDLVTYYNAILDARAAELAGKSDGQAVIKQAVSLTSGRVFMDPDQNLERTYALGLARVQLPGTLGVIGLNPSLVAKMPTIGKNAHSKLVIYHQGSYPGYLSAVFMIPEDEIVIVVLTNSLPLNDAADWLGQPVLEYVLDIPNKTDFVSLPQESVHNNLKAYAELDDFIASIKPRDPDHPLEAYAGDYFNPPGNFAIRVTEADGKLQLHFQEAEWDAYLLTCIGEDLFTWVTDFENKVRRGRWPLSGTDYFEFRFEANAKGVV